MMTLNWVDLISAALGLSCVILAGRRLVANFYIGYIYNIFLFFLLMTQGLYAVMAIQIIALAINGLGHYRWTHPKEGEKDGKGTLAVTRLSLAERLLYSGFTIVGAVAIFFVLSRTDDQRPVLDACSAAMILLAQWLSAQKKLECWIVWMAVNVLNLVLYLSSGLIFMPIVSALYLANGIWSFVSWKKNERDIEN